ncbi:uncharacterized protein V1510DRAFT_361344 [Dipodascopsis tothii]|uniref:uncharacterized protein n=1 Tax=Dipodascopsis tothii TaxID=44089 RepID=UPI0034CF66D4
MGTNAIANILNSPATAAQYTRVPGTREIAPVALPNLDIVQPSDFADYISQVSDEYGKYVHLRSVGEEDDDDRTPQQKRLPQRADSLATFPPPAARVTPAPSLPSPAQTEAENSLLRYIPGRRASPAAEAMHRQTSGSSSGSSRRSAVSERRTPTPAPAPALPPLSTVPQVYFDPGFKLENPRVFDVVSERADLSFSYPATGESEPGSARKPFASNAMLQEKLSWYLDTVELHLIDEISKASSSFFTALTDLRNLHTETRDAVGRIKGLREDLQRVDKEQAEVGLEIVRLRRRRDNVLKVRQGVVQMETAMTEMNKADALWRQGELEACLAQLGAVGDIVDGRSADGHSWPYPLLDLKLVPGMAAVTDQAAALRTRIGKDFQGQLVGLLIGDLRRHVQAVPSHETLSRLTQTFATSKAKLTAGGGPATVATNTDYAVVADGLRVDVEACFRLLVRSGNINGAIQGYRDAVMREVKNFIKAQLPATMDDGASVSSTATGRSNRSTSTSTSNTTSTAEKSIALAKMLRAMSPQEFQTMVVDIFTSISELLRRLSTQQKLLLDVTSKMDELDVVLDISDLIRTATDVTQGRMVRVLNVRKDQNTTMDMNSFLAYYGISRIFLAECEAITGRFGTELQGTVFRQVKQSVFHFHEERLQTQIAAIEHDTWSKPATLPESLQITLNTLLSSATRDPDEWRRAVDLQAAPVEDVAQGRPGGGASPARTPATDAPRTHLSIDQDTFRLTPSGALLLKNVERYMTLIVVLPQLSLDVVAYLQEFLRVMNGRVAQVTNAAQAQKQRELQLSVNRARLDLAGQFLALVIAVIPYVRECARRHAGAAAADGDDGTAQPSTAVAELDKVRRLLQEHQVNVLHVLETL